MNPGCHVTTGVLAGMETVRLESDQVALTLLAGKGADILELRYRPADVDVMWKAPWGPRDPRATLATTSSVVAWLDSYSGGWQVLFPSGGGPSVHRGVELVFHGEASIDPWTVVETAADAISASVRLALHLVRSPFSIERTVTVRTGSPSVRIVERITNHAAEPMEYMWGHHPAYGPPFLEAGCRIETGATTVAADDAYDGPGNALAPGSRHRWPHVEAPGRTVDLSIVPPDGPARTMLGYLGDFTSGWYAITNPRLGFGVGLAWPADLLPYAWMWQEMRSTSGYPWWGTAYTMAIEPNTSVPGQGLAKAIEAGTHRTLAPGAAQELELVATFFPAGDPIAGIDLDGTVHRR
jgi:hypothetical protein